MVKRVEKEDEEKKSNQYAASIDAIKIAGVVDERYQRSLKWS
jgi:hypothetical protein